MTKVSEIERPVIGFTFRFRKNHMPTAQTFSLDCPNCTSTVVHIWAEIESKQVAKGKAYSYTVDIECLKCEHTSRLFEDNWM